jgi:isopentenyl-diphosphate delta-isomerase
MDLVLLVDEHDNELGVLEKIEAHVQGVLHRAFSVFIFNSDGEMLLQKRSASKYHSPNLWTNACCSHPRPNESTAAAAERRLAEELGFSTKLTPAFNFTYRASFENGLIEHEYDHVFTAVYDGLIVPNAAEVSDLKFLSVEEIKNELNSSPSDYTAWFHLAFPQLLRTDYERILQLA